MGLEDFMIKIELQEFKLRTLMWVFELWVVILPNIIKDKENMKIMFRYIFTKNVSFCQVLPWF